MKTKPEVTSEDYDNLIYELQMTVNLLADTESSLFNQKHALGIWEAKRAVTNLLEDLSRDKFVFDEEVISWF